ncbi:MAG: carboxypeptidase-like regulatory domain-containing protein [Spirosomaceae bacterium]|nr:carboxypeptidase-like regulatory domain-containing protein [Spirosomataceae bacterium]
MLNFKSKLLGAVMLVLLFSVSSFAKDVVVEGTVRGSEDNEPLPGVSVVVKGTTNGTTTGIDGKYKLTVSDNATLTFSFVGYEVREIKVGIKA